MEQARRALDQRNARAASRMSESFDSKLKKH